MRVHFAATIDDMVDVQLRALARSRVARSWEWKGIVPAGLVAGLILYAFVPVAPETRLIVAGCGAVAAAVSYVFLYRLSVRRRLRQYFQEQFGDNANINVAVELTASGVSVEQNGGEMNFDWNEIEKIFETPDSVDFHARHGGIIVIRKRAFDSADAMRQFVELAERYRVDAQRPGGLVN